LTSVYLLYIINLINGGYSVSRYNRWKHEEFLNMANKIHNRSKGNGTLIKRGKIYHARWVVNGKPFSKSTGTGNRQEAEAKLAEFTAPFRLGNEAETLQAMAARIEGHRAEAQKYDDETPATTIHEGWGSYLRQPNRPDTGDTTLRQYEFQYEAFAKWMEIKYPDVKELRYVTQDHADEYAAQLQNKVAASTFNKHLNLLTLVWKVLKKKAKLDENPWTEISRKRSVSKSRRELTVDELGRVCEAAEGEMRLLIAIGLYCGFRLVDAACLKWSGVDLVRGKISVVPVKTRRRAGKTVTVPIHQTLHEMLSETPRSKRSGYVMPGLAERYNIKGALSRDVAKLFNSVGIETTEKLDGKRGVAVCGFHSLRHTFVSLCAEGGVSHSVVQSLVGHGSPAMTAHYTHIGLEAAQNAVAVLPDVTRSIDCPSVTPQLRALGGHVDAVVASLEGLSVEELDTVAKEARALIRAKKGKKGGGR